MRGVEIHNVANDLNLADPSAFRRLPRLLLNRLQGRHGTATLGHGDRIALIIYLIKEGQALGL
jgi:hypothetical protein